MCAVHLPVSLKLFYQREWVCYYQSNYVNNWCLLLRNKPTGQEVKDIAKTELSPGHFQESMEDRWRVRGLAPGFSYILRKKDGVSLNR